MKRLLKYMMMGVMALTLSATPAFAQGRHNGASGQRYRPSATTRPGTQPPAQKPGGGHHGNHPGFGPSHQGPRPGHMTPPPPRPGRPVYRPWSRPLPPPAGWRPVNRVPLFNSILGLSFGTSLNVSLNMLGSQGFMIDGFDNGVVYLRDVNQLGLIWPDACLYYNNGGGLMGSEFYYASPYNDPSRFQLVYNSLVRRYGLPVANNGSSMVWYGFGNNYISLNYAARPTFGGVTSYVTTLTFGQ